MEGCLSLDQPLLRLPHRRNDEGLIADVAFGPALGDGFDFGPEADAFGAVLVGVTEGGAFPAAKGVIADRNWDWHVHTDHADINLRGKLSCGAAIAGEDGDTVAVLVV